MDNDNIEFNKLEFNLYELMNLPIDCTVEEVKKQFKKIVKKFHPDKISQLEEKLYYNITLAYHILSKQSSKNKYNEWLLESNRSHSSLKNNFTNDLNNVYQYFPKNSREAQLDFIEKNKILASRHGNLVEDTRSISSIYKEKDFIRKNIPAIIKEDFTDMKEFNVKFSHRRKNGIFSNKIIKYEDKIIPYQSGSNRFTELKDIDKMYVNDKQLEEAFSLINFNDTINYDNVSLPIDKIDEYNKNSRKLNKKITLNDIGI